MLASVTHILPLTNIRRRRLLPLPGNVLVRVGQRVNATDIIAQAQITAGHTLLDIRRGLRMAKASEAEHCIVRQPGDKLEKGDVIAEVKGLFSRIVRAPIEGEIVMVMNGQVLLRTSSATHDLLAGMNGVVVEIIPDMGGVIEVDGALIQGAWGNGRIVGGPFNIVASTPDEEWTSQKFDVSLRGKVVMSGRCESEDALRAGRDLSLGGLILASMSSHLIPLAIEMPYPILLIEGFGNIPMNPAAYKLLTTSDKRDISINAGCQPDKGERPEAIIPLPASGNSALDADNFKTGQTVRVQGAPFTGKIGTIVQLKQGLYTFSNGLKAAAADVQLEGETKVAVPLSNLEVIE